MHPVYYVPSGDTLPVPFNTFSSDDPTASITLTGLAVTDVEIYKDVSMTQRASDNGIALTDTDGIDLDGITGIHGFSIDTSDNSDAGFYTVGAWFTVVVSSITVDGATINFIACVFRLMAAEDAAGVPDVNVTHFGGSAGTFSSGRPEVNTTHVAGTAQTANDIGQDVNDILTDTADMQPKLGTPAGASMSADIAAVKSQTAAIETDTQDIQTKVGTPSDFGSGTSTIAANLQDMADNGTATFDRSTDSLQAIRDRGDAAWATATGFSTHSAADVWTNGTRTLTANTNLNDPTAATIADAVWDEARADHTTQGTYGESFGTIVKGTVDTVTNTHTPTTTVFQADDITEATADHFIGRVVIFTTGALKNQATDITDYEAVGGIGQFTVTALTEAPANNDQFVII